MIVCSNCFHDIGLKKEAEKIGKNDNTTCPFCKSTTGKKLNEDDIEELCHLFFVKGSFYKTEYGGASVLMINHEGVHDAIDCKKVLKQDVKFLNKHFGINVFYYAPQMWRIGMNDWLDNLNNGSLRKRIKAINNIIDRCSSICLNTDTLIYRLRTDISHNVLYSKEYDAPPKQTFKNGRLNLRGNVVFYAAFDIETCIHEGRATMNDELYIATFKPQKQLKLLDVTNIQESETEATPFENLDIAVRFIFTASTGSYKTTQLLAQTILERGYDGIIYPSYFNQVRDQEYKNIALFGKPVEERKLDLIGINKVIMNRVIYDIRLGPAIEY